MDITLYDTRTRAKVRLDPVTPGRASMYVCGPTVYDRAHIGNARPVVVFDTLFRLLRHVYGAENVTYVRNITDVDDKIIARARESGREIGAITEETTRWYHEDMGALGALRPTFEPRATEHVGGMIAMIALLIERGHAYSAEGHVLFSVGSFAEYGRLARRSLEDMRAGARVEIAPYKRDPMDFVLWKPSDADTPGWDSPWGRGRPGWHIECSAMARALLGGAFDIHGGGVDLAFPHHENELAQSVCAHPDEGFARIWMHNGMLNVEGEKMSKSLGNFFTVRDLLDQGMEGYVVRMALLMTHYSDTLDWSTSRVREAEAKVKRWRRAMDAVVRLYENELRRPHSVDISLADDLNTPRAVELVDKAARVVLDNTYPVELRESASQIFLEGIDLLGFSEMASEGFGGRDKNFVEEFMRRPTPLSIAVEKLKQARAVKDWNKADRIRKAIIDAGVKIMITKEDIVVIPRPSSDYSKLREIE